MKTNLINTELLKLYGLKESTYIRFCEKNKLDKRKSESKRLFFSAYLEGKQE